jgi:hypothetical protein
VINHLNGLLLVQRWYYYSLLGCVGLSFSKTIAMCTVTILFQQMSMYPLSVYMIVVELLVVAYWSPDLESLWGYYSDILESCSIQFPVWHCLLSAQCQPLLLPQFLSAGIKVLSEASGSSASAAVTFITAVTIATSKLPDGTKVSIQYRSIWVRFLLIRWCSKLRCSCYALKSDIWAIKVH